MTCGAIQNESRPMTRCQRMSQPTPQLPTSFAASNAQSARRRPVICTTPWYTARRSDCRVVLGPHRAVSQAEPDQSWSRTTEPPGNSRRVRARVARLHRDHRRARALGRDDPLQMAGTLGLGRDGHVSRRSDGLDRRPLRRRQVQDEPAPRPALREHAELQARGRAAVERLAGARRGRVRAPSGGDRSMPSDETRRVLKLFGVAVTSLEEAIDTRAPFEEVMKWDGEVAERTREVLALVDRLRSRRIA